MARDSEGPPKAYLAFIERHPGVGEAWERLREAEAEGPLEAKVRRLVKLAVAAGHEAEGAVHSAARKAMTAGASREEIRQVVLLAASTIGLPAAVKVHRWVEETLD